MTFFVFVGNFHICFSFRGCLFGTLFLCLILYVLKNVNVLVCVNYWRKFVR